MILYDNQKRFAGISSELLEMLHFGSMNELLAKTGDIADFFVSKPGYIFNFKNFSWIDYVLYSGIKEPKVIIQGQKEKQLIADIQIAPFFLLGQEGGFSEGYLIKLANPKIREASGPEISIEPPPYEPSFARSAPFSFKTPEPLSEAKPSVQAKAPEMAAKPKPAEVTLTVPTSNKAANSEMTAKPKQAEVAFSFELAQEALAPTEFDPTVAARELGLPQNLIVEFVQDFIREANDYKAGLEQAIKEQDFNKLRTISHKIKGAAANLRIKNIVKTMDVIHESKDLDTIQKAISTLYEQIGALQGPALANQTPREPTSGETETSDIVFKAQPPEPEKEDIYPFELPAQNASFDLKKAASELGLPITLVKEFAGDFVTQAENLREQIENATASGDTLTLKSLFGNLKGAAIHLRMQKLSSLIQDIQSGAEIEEISNKKDEFFALLENLKKSIKENA